MPDHLQSTIAVTDAAGVSIEHLQYEPFGDGPTSSYTRYTFTGRERDGLTGLIYYRARWREPQHGRFLSEDPVGLLASDTNLYAYVDNDPQNLVDPFGLSTLPLDPRLKKEADPAEILKAKIEREAKDALSNHPVAACVLGAGLAGGAYQLGLKIPLKGNFNLGSNSQLNIDGSIQKNGQGQPNVNITLTFKLKF